MDENQNGEEGWVFESVDVHVKNLGTSLTGCGENCIDSTCAA
jgi:hypothetical protein